MDIRAVLESIAPTPQVKPKKRHSYVIIGKPGCGKTTLATKLAQVTKNQVINIEEIVNDMQRNPTNPIYQQVHYTNKFEQALKSGGVVEAQSIYDEMIKLTTNKKTLSRGFILDGIPLCTPELDFDAQMDYITNLVQTYGNCVLIDLRISNQDLVRRRAGLWLDPVTNETFPTQQVLYSRQRRQEGWVDGEQDLVFKEETEKYKPELVVAEPIEKEGESDQEDSEEIVPSGPKVYPLANRKAYPILTEKVLDRLIKLPENDPEVIQREAELYIKGEPRLDLFRKKEFNLLKTIELDATQHPEQLFSQLMVRLHSRGFSVNDPFVSPIKLLGPDSGFQGVSDLDILKYYNQMNIQDHEPEREFSDYFKFCPVTFKETGRLVSAKMEIAAKYKGKLYFFVDEPSIDKFCSSPEEYVCLHKQLPPTTICVIGTPISGKTSISKVLAERYGLFYVSVDNLVAECAESQDPEYSQFFQKIQPVLLQGGQIDAAAYIELIQISLLKGATKGYKGWVLDGFPRSAEQANLLVQADIIPEHVYIMQADTGVDVVSELIHEKKLSTMNQPYNPLPFYEEVCQHFNSQELPEMNIMFAEKSPRTNVHNISWKGNTLVTTGVILQSLDPFVPQATPCTRLADTEPCFGLTKDFCPVVLYKEKRLQKGDPSLVANFLGRFYYFSNEDCRSQFISCPFVFLKDIHLPPPRIIFFGPSGSGKMTVMKEVSKKWDIPFVDYRTLLLELAERSEFSEHKEQIIATLNGTGTLGGDLVKQVVKVLFVEEPYTSKGFLLRSFPIAKADLDAILKERLYPDAFVTLKVESEIAAKRKFAFRKTEIEEQEKNRLSKLEELTRVVPESIDTPENLHLKQTLLLSDEKIMEELAVKFQMENSQVADFHSLVEGPVVGVPLLTVNASRCHRPVMAEVYKVLKPYLTNRSSMLLSSTKLPWKKAMDLIEMGIKRYSNIGQHCPVTLKSTQRVDISGFGEIPVSIGDDVYFLKGKNNLVEFENNLALYLNQPTPKPFLAPTCCIIGNPKAGKSTLARSLASELGAIPMTVSQILQSILDGNEATSLYEQIRNGLASGESLPDQVVVDAVNIMTTRLISNGKGWILDGFPVTFEQAKLLEATNFRPHVFFELTANESDLIQRAQFDLDEESVNHSTPGLHLADHTLLRNEEWKKSCQNIRDLFDSKFSNWVIMDAGRSRWDLKHEAQEVCGNGLFRRQNYIDLKSQEKAAPISGIGLSNEFILSNQSQFKFYCPVTLVDDKFLYVSSNSSPFMAEHKEKYYYLRDESSLAKFLASPDQYAQHSLPDELPQRRSRSDLKNMFPKTLSFKGYCPVTFFEGPPGFDSIVPGLHEDIVEYEGNLFAFRDETQLQKFMSTPWKYSAQTLPVKLPPPNAPIPLVGLPVVGYLEQTIASTLTKGLLDIGKTKPKHPFRTIEESAREYLGLFLKASNPKSKDWVKKKYASRLEKYRSNCELMTFLAKSLPDMKKDIPKQGFDAQLDRFLQFKPTIQ